MRRINNGLFILLGCLINAAAWSQTLVLKSEEHQWTGYHPKLKNLWASTEQLQIGQKRRSYMTRMSAAYKTHHPEDIEAFVFVNYIRGCQYTTNAQGHKDRSIVREFFGQSRFLFHHPEWVVDSVDLDPAYYSHEQLTPPRHALYSWVDELSGQSFRYHTKKPTQAVLLSIQDRPGSAFFADDLGVSKNISLEFKTCLFEAVHVPTRIASPHALSQENAIWCFEWQSFFEFDANSQKIEMKDSINPYCL